jgi:predicted ATPase
MFARLRLDNWRQFAHVEVNFHPRLTVLTGANGSGKTTILHLLNRHWGWNLNYVSTPRWDRKGTRQYWAGFWDESENETWSKTSVTMAPAVQASRIIGEVGYSNGQSAILAVPETVAEVFAVEIRNQHNMDGVYVPSHRAPYIFQRVDVIATQLDAKEQIFQAYVSELMARFNPSGRTQSPSFRIKSSLISLATFGYGNQAVDRNDDAVKVFEGFEKILLTVLPASLGFKRLRVRVPDVLLDTGTGEFSFDAVSGGVAAIIDIAWQIFMYSQLHDEFVVVIDEPEAHLHPALQQRLLPDLLTAFPRCQFIIATHNPFLVTSVADSNVYVLSYNAANRVESQLLSAVNKAGSTDEILRDVLGIPFTLPQWVQGKLDEILRTFSAMPLTEQSLATLRTQMAELGLSHLFPSELARALEGKK